MTITEVLVSSHSVFQLRELYEHIASISIFRFPSKLSRARVKSMAMTKKC